MQNLIAEYDCLRCQKEIRLDGSVVFEDGKTYHNKCYVDMFNVKENMRQRARLEGLEGKNKDLVKHVHKLETGIKEAVDMLAYEGRADAIFKHLKGLEN